MENKILEVLLDIQKDLKNVQNDVKGVKEEIKGINDRLDKMEYRMNDGFETLEIKIDEVDLKLRKSNKRLSEQIASNMESIEKLKN